MANDLESSISAASQGENTPRRRSEPTPDWLQVGAVAAASALLGGLAAAWFYRKTISRLREAEDTLPVSGSAAIEDGSPEDF